MKTKQLALEALIGELGLAATHLSRYDAPGIPMNPYAAICHEAADALNAYSDLAAKVEPVAYAIYTENGSMRIWTTEQPHLQIMAEELGTTVVRLYAAAQQAEAPAGWMPIESAPRSTKEMFVVKAFDVLAGSGRYTSDPYCVWHDDVKFVRWPHEFSPTHWTPLPETPKDAP